MAANTTVTVGPLEDVTLVWPHGDTAQFRFEFYDDAAKTTPSDFTGWTVEAELKLKSSRVEYWSFTVDDTNLDTGVVLLTTPTGTSTPGGDPLPNVGVWDMRRRLSGSIKTMIGGAAVLEPTVTAIP